MASKTFQDDQLNHDVLQALVLLLAVMVLPVLVRIRTCYTFLWIGFSAVATYMESPAACGLATVMGLSVLLAWYALRLFDRPVFNSVLLGWFGLLSEYRVFRWLANAGDFVLHFLCPVAQAGVHLPHVRVWMTLPIVGFSVLYVLLVSGGSLVANHIYCLSPPRPLQSWLVVSAAMLVANLAVPLGCVLAHESGVYQWLTAVSQDAATALSPFQEIAYYA